MAKENEQLDVFRTLHLPGGLRVMEIASDMAKIGPLAGGEVTLPISSPAAFGNDARRNTGLRALGIEFFRSEEEIGGLAQANWRPILPSHNEWPTDIAELNWFGAFQCRLQPE